MAEENNDNLDPQYKEQSGDNKGQESNSEVTEQNNQNQQDENQNNDDQNVEQESFDYQQYENLVDFVEQAGFDTEMIDAYLDQHGTIPDALYNAWVEAHGALIANTLKRECEQGQANYQNEIKANDKRLHEHLEKAFEGITEQSGAETWNELKQWAQTNLADQKEELNGMLKQGGMQAELALDFIVNKFKNSEDFTQPANLTDGEEFASDFAGTPLSKQGYNDKLNELLGKGFAYDSVEVQRLQRQRMKSMRRGH